MKFTFLYRDGNSISIEAESCKHYTGHAALIKARIIHDTNGLLKEGQHFDRLNLSFNELFAMYPSNS